MAGVTTTHDFNGTLDQVYGAITDYESYPDYIPGVLKVIVLEPLADGAACSVRYEINVVKTIHYTLNMFHTKPLEVSWELESSNLMKKNEGYWRLHDKSDGIVAADYSVDLKFRGLVPSAIVKKLTETNLPAMFEGFQELIRNKS